METRYCIERLDNGVCVASACMPQMASVCLGIWAGVGSRFEDPPCLNGVSHFIEHLLFKGTEKRSALQISVDVEGIGGTLNAFTTEENTCFFARSRSEHLEILMDVLSDMYCHASFKASEIAREREVIQEEIAMTIDQPSEHVLELINARQWGEDHPLGRSITGTERGLKKIKREDIMSYYKRHYTTGNTWVIAAGNLEHSHLIELAKKYTKDIPIAASSAYTPFVPFQTQPGIIIRTWDELDQTQFAFGIRTYEREHPSYFVLKIINTLVGENSSSRLFQVIREEKGLAYSIGSSTSAFFDTGDMVISGGVEPEHLEETLKLIVNELKSLSQKCFSKNIIRHAQDYIIGQFELNIENTENHETWFGEELLGRKHFLTPQEINDAIYRVSADEIQAVFLQLIKPERYNLAIIGEKQSKEKLLKILAS